MRFLVVNADDFGLSPFVNRGIVAAHERGIVTSASLMVRGRAAEDAAAYACSHRRLSTGLHVDLAEWSWRDGTWEAEYEVVDTGDTIAVEQEVERQLRVFRTLVLRDPTHLDSHQHTHREEPVATALAAVAADLGIPLRDADPAIRYRGDFYGQGGRGEPYPAGITIAALEEIIEGLPDGWTELGCHPGEPDTTLPSMYRDERAVELAVLCDPQARAALSREHVELASFADLARA